MSNTKWTPGPWRVPSKDVGIVGRYVRDDYGTVEVCRVGAFADKELLPFNRDRWTADANLIAAAPDLYEALEHAKEMLEEYETESTGESFNSLMINAALAKARGETQ